MFGKSFRLLSANRHPNNMKFILGTKVNMTQIFDEKGTVHPVTVLKAGPIVVTQVKTVATDGYNAIQVGYGTRAAKNINKAMTGHMKGQTFMNLREFRLDAEPTFKVGDSIDLSTFSAGDKVTISSISKGKGFQGGVKRYGFKGGPRSHGQKHSEREPGSLGGGGRDGGRGPLQLAGGAGRRPGRAPRGNRHRRRRDGYPAASAVLAAAPSHLRPRRL